MLLRASAAPYTPSANTINNILPSPTHAGTYRATFERAQKQPGYVDHQDYEQWNPPPPCPQCNSLTQQQRSGAIIKPGQKTATLGMVSRLPSESTIKSWSVAAPSRQAALNSGAYGHPCISVAESECGHLFACAPVTSFGGNTIQTKYQNAGIRTKDNMFWSYLALNAKGTKAHNGMYGLDTKDGCQMPKQSYVHLDGLFWIEKINLGTHNYSDGRVTLTQDSLAKLQWACAVAEKHRREHNTLDVAVRFAAAKPLNPLLAQPNGRGLHLLNASQFTPLPPPRANQPARKTDNWSTSSNWRART